MPCRPAMVLSAPRSRPRCARAQGGLVSTRLPAGSPVWSARTGEATLAELIAIVESRPFVVGQDGHQLVRTAQAASGASGYTAMRPTRVRIPDDPARGRAREQRHVTPTSWCGGGRPRYGEVAPVATERPPGGGPSWPAPRSLYRLDRSVATLLPAAHGSTIRHGGAWCLIAAMAASVCQRCLYAVRRAPPPVEPRASLRERRGPRIRSATHRRQGGSPGTACRWASDEHLPGPVVGNGRNTPAFQLKRPGEAGRAGQTPRRSPDIS